MSDIRIELVLDRRSLAILALGTLALPLTLGAVTVPHTFTNGTAAESSEVNENFAALEAAVDANEGGIATNAAAIPTADNLGWMTQHSGAAGGCAAASPVGGSPISRAVLPKRSGFTCTQTCATYGGVRNQCTTSIAVGLVRPTQAAAYDDVLATYYNYGCGDSQAAYDEVMGQGIIGGGSSYTAYCCCYQ